MSGGSQLGPDVERYLEERGERAAMADRELLSEGLLALLFLVVAAVLPSAFGSGDGPDVLLAATFVAVYAFAFRVRFNVGGGDTIPTQLVFVPMLFVLPPEWVPLLVALGGTVGRLPRFLREKRPAERVLLSIPDAWYSVAPALIFASADVDGVSWDEWPIWIAALAAQFLLDTAFGVARELFAAGVAPQLTLRTFSLVYLVDALLSPVGLLAAVAAQERQYAFLLVVPLLLLLRAFARERQARIDQALELSSTYRRTALLLGDVIGEDDEYTGVHSQGVVSLAVAVADELKVGETERQLVEFGALLHDVGKIAIPKAIINKPGPLTPQEWEVIRRHTVEGQRMLDRVGGSLADVGVVVRSSHERWDGGGYPDGLAGEEIPLAARIVTAADAFSAMTTDRTYRTALTREAAVAELRDGAGKQFDPRVAEATIAIVERYGLPRRVAPLATATA